jgi:bacterioferritin
MAVPLRILYNRGSPHIKEASLTAPASSPILGLLQTALRAEHAAIVQFMSHAHRLREVETLHVVEGIARQDMRHFKWLSEMVVKLGGNPTLERGPVALAPASPRVWLQADLALVEDAIAFYGVAIDQTPGEPEVRRLFERLLADEVDHRGRLARLIEHWRDRAPEDDAEALVDHPGHAEAVPPADPQVHGFLDFAIRHEYAVILQYLHHAFLMDDQRVSRDMEEIAIEEMRHLGWLSEALVERGGLPEWEADRLELTEDPVEMLELDLQREIEVEADYKEFTAAMADPEIKAIFDRIGQHETYHAGVIGEMLERLKATRQAQRDASVAAAPAKCPFHTTVGSLLGQPQS